MTYNQRCFPKFIYIGIIIVTEAQCFWRVRLIDFPFTFLPFYSLLTQTKAVWVRVNYIQRHTTFTLDVIRLSDSINLFRYVCWRRRAFFPVRLIFFRSLHKFINAVELQLRPSLVSVCGMQSWERKIFESVGVVRLCYSWWNCGGGIWDLRLD